MADQTTTQDQPIALVPSNKRKRNATRASGPRKPKVKPVECPVCLTGRPPKLILDPLACNCVYCVPCIRELFSVSLQSEDGISNYPAQCCGKVLDHVLLEGHLTPQLRKAYKSKVEEMASNDPLYCGKSACGAFIPETAIKDNFGSCGKCKMKTCVKKECNKTKAEHFGIHDICPGELETDELRELAEEKGWKRCPKCCALTERSKGCNDIRCVCRTEWCYICGKPLRGTRNACRCYPPRVPPPAPAPVQPTQDDSQLQREPIVIQGDDDQDTDMVDVKPSIEDIQRQSGGLFYTESDFMAELQRHANFSPQPDSRDLAAQPQVPSSQAEQDVMDELDALAAPNARATRNSQQTPEVHAMNAERDQFSIARESSIGSVPDSLEDMLRVYNSYEASLSSSSAAVSSVDSDIVETNPVNHSPQPARHGSAEPTPISLHNSNLGSSRHDNIATDPLPEPPRYAHTPALEISLDASTINIPDDQTTRTTTPAQTSVTATSEANADSRSVITHPNTESDPDPDFAHHSTQAHFDGASTQLPETTQSDSDAPTQLDSEWLMDSVEEYLMHDSGWQGQ